MDERERIYAEVEQRLTNDETYLNMFNLFAFSQKELTENDRIQGSISGASAEILNISEPILQPYSGDMLYLENRPPITKIENQSETYRLIIKF